MSTDNNTRKVSIVMTTIFDPESLDQYAANIDNHGRSESSEVIVIGDRKVHPSIVDRITEINRKYGDIIDWWDFDRQTEWMTTNAPGLISDIPANSDNRRNVGYLIALSRGSDVVISVDDDNFPQDSSDYVGEHLNSGATYSGDVITESGWFNIMTMLDSNPNIPMWPRGYPYSLRGGASQQTKNVKHQELTIGLNAGLWLGDPDIDAITRISIHPDVISVAETPAVLKDTFSPINSQNTSVIKQLLPAYYYFRMDEPLYCWPVNRFGDIWQGFVVQAVAYHLGFGLRVGSPAVRQLRNDHDLLIDLRQELPGILVNEWLSELIANFRFSSQDAGGCVIELYEEILTGLKTREEFPIDVHEYFVAVAQTAYRWVETCRAIH